MAFEDPLTVGKPIKISGYVIDEITNKPLSEITVTNGYDSVTTNGDGYFLLVYNYEERKSTITFFIIGYESQTLDISKETSSSLEYIYPIKLKSNSTLSTLNIVGKRDNKFSINGFIVDENGKGISGAVITLEWFPKLSLAQNITQGTLPITPPPINKTVIADNNGVFEFNSLIDWDLDKSSLTVSSPGYNEKVISLTNAYIVGKNYPIGRINLTPESTPVISDEEVKSNIKQTASENIPDEPGFAQRLLVSTIKTFNAALDKLIPYLSNMLLAFGPALANAALKEGSALTPKLCPSSEKLNSLIIARNGLVTQINILYNGLRILTQLSNTTTTLINGLTAALNLYYIAPYPAIGIPALALPPLTAGTISFIDNARQTLKEDLDKNTGVVKGIGIVIGYCLSILAYILNVLNILDQIILACAKNQQIDFLMLNPEITSAINATVNDSLIQDNIIYKGFKLELKLDTTNNTAYPKRYAQALNLQSVPVLKTDSSFASNPQVLIDQLKFIIDSNPNLTAG